MKKSKSKQEKIDNETLQTKETQNKENKVTKSNSNRFAKIKEFLKDNEKFMFAIGFAATYIAVLGYGFTISSNIKAQDKRALENKQTEMRDEQGKAQEEEKLQENGKLQEELKSIEEQLADQTLNQEIE